MAKSYNIISFKGKIPKTLAANKVNNVRMTTFIIIIMGDGGPQCH